MQRLMTSVKTTQKAIDQLIEAAESHGLPVKVRSRGDVDNIYIGGKLIAERFPGYSGVIVDVEPVEP